jgi:hypothetical protein
VYSTIRGNGEWDNWSMVEIEKYPCKDANEAISKEREWFERLSSSLNTYYPQRSDKEYKENNKDKKDITNKQYRDNHKEEIALRLQQYNINNKNKISLIHPIYEVFQIVEPLGISLTRRHLRYTSKSG